MNTASNNVNFKEFHTAEGNSLYWYDFLLNAHISVSDIPNTECLVRTFEKVTEERAEVSLLEIDQMSAAVLSNHELLRSINNWYDIYVCASQRMSNELHAAGNRSIRMRYQRLVYAIQKGGLAVDCLPLAGLRVISEETLPGKKVWDYLYWQNAEWWLSSDEQNLHRRDAYGKVTSWRVGLPTQFDVLDDMSLFIGSIYSPGGYILTKNLTLERLPHKLPVVAAWKWNGQLQHVDNTGCVFNFGSEKALYKINCRSVHFARFIDDKLFILDNGNFGKIYIVDVGKQVSTELDIFPVQVCNDITRLGDHYYLIDKQQGYIFRYDMNFNFLSKSMSFGTGYGQLVDPVMVRSIDRVLHVISWVNSKHATIEI